MAKKKPATVNRIRKRATAKTSSPEMELTPSKSLDTLYPSHALNRPKLPLTLLIPLLIVVILAIFLWRNRGLIVAATVNGQPIWRWTLESRLNERYASSTIDELINEQIIRNEAAGKGVRVSQDDVKAKTSEIEKSLQGKITLSEALAQQGMTMADFRRQLEIQLLIEKLTANETKISDEEINTYIEKNRESLTATDEASLREEAKQSLLREKQSQAFQELFQKLKSQAKVSKFL